jgi:hypothetical protein
MTSAALSSPNAYRLEIGPRGVVHNNKLDFLWIYKKATLLVLSEDNIKAGS